MFLKLLGVGLLIGQIDLSKVKCQCTKCGNISIKRVGNLKSFKRQPMDDILVLYNFYIQVTQ